MKPRLGPLGAPLAVIAVWTGARIMTALPEDQTPLPGRSSPKIARVIPPRQPPLVMSKPTFTDAVSMRRYFPSAASPDRYDAPVVVAAAMQTAPSSDEIQAAEPLAPAPSPFVGKSGVVAGYNKPARAPRRVLSGSGWALVNGTGGAIGVPSLGGSQTGLRVFLQGAEAPLALTARVSRALGQAHDTEISAGYALRTRGIGLLAERRERLDARSGAFVLTGYGGLYDVRLPVGLRFDGFVQGGVAGLRQRRWFADGQTRVTARTGVTDRLTLGVGGGAWASAQQGIRRVEGGPLVETRWRSGTVGLRVAGEYRFRVTGDANPRSGPALTVGVDF